MILIFRCKILIFEHLFQPFSDVFGKSFVSYGNAVITAAVAAAASYIVIKQDSFIWHLEVGCHAAVHTTFESHSRISRWLKLALRCVAFAMAVRSLSVPKQTHELRSEQKMHELCLSIFNETQTHMKPIEKTKKRRKIWRKANV